MLTILSRGDDEQTDYRGEAASGVLRITHQLQAAPYLQS